jgi:membrane protease YdiL (CAAX protease family)
MTRAPTMYNTSPCGRPSTATANPVGLTVALCVLMAVPEEFAFRGVLLGSAVWLWDGGRER